MEDKTHSGIHCFEFETLFSASVLNATLSGLKLWVNMTIMWCFCAFWMSTSVLTFMELKLSVGVQHQVTSLPLQRRKIRRQVLSFGPLYGGFCCC